MGLSPDKLRFIRAFCRYLFFFPAAVASAAVAFAAAAALFAGAAHGQYAQGDYDRGQYYVQRFHGVTL